MKGSKIRINLLSIASVACLLLFVQCGTPSFDVTIESLLNEMTNRATVTKKPVYPYRTLQASSYDRASVTPDDPKSWFANNDYNFYLRKETNNGRTESVLMECEGPGVVTRVWTPFFYFDFNNRKGTDIMFYLDGDTCPTIRTNFIELVSGKSFVAAPFAGYTCRAGDLYLPVSFGKSCKITVEGKPFYYIINYRAYDKNVKVETFKPEFMTTCKSQLESTGRELTNPTPYAGGRKITFSEPIRSTETATLNLPTGSSAIHNIEFRLKADSLSQALRSTVVEMLFDGKTTVWCPIGDFFGNVNSVEPYSTWERDVRADSAMICRWQMPYREKGEIRIHNLCNFPVHLSMNVTVDNRKWTDDSYYFHANWWTDDPYPAHPHRDMTYVEVVGEGVYVGDNISVLNPLPWWWGEGDEKIYVDEDFDRKFPSHFGTGTEDYYGWAGGEHPTRADEFSVPFLANIRVGGERRGFTGNEPHTRGYNICTRSRSLDAIPFTKRFRANIEAWNYSSGPDAVLQYSLTSFWYGNETCSHNRPPMEKEASRPVPQVENLAGLKMDN